MRYHDRAGHQALHRSSKTFKDPGHVERSPRHRDRQITRGAGMKVTWGG